MTRPGIATYAAGPARASSEKPVIRDGKFVGFPGQRTVAETDARKPRKGA